MSVAVLPSTAFAPFCSENYLCWAPPEEQCKVNEHHPFPAVENEEEDRPGQLDIWNAIQSKKANSGAADPPAPYVHPFLRRSSSQLSQKSLEVCTESLGSETGSDDFSFLVDHLDNYNSPNIIEAVSQEEKMGDKLMHDKQEAAKFEEDDHISGDVRPSQKGKELTSVNYHCSINRKSQPRSFPPPLPSISRRDGPCLHMKPHRRGGRLVVEAVPVPSQNYLHAQREGGRLLLSFVDATFDEPPSCFGIDKNSDIVGVPQKEEEKLEIHEDEKGQVPEETEAPDLASEEVLEEMEENNLSTDEEEEEIEEEEEEEEVEVVDRGTVVEVKVSTQPQQQSSAAKVLRSSVTSVVINKFVGDTPVVPAVSSTTVEPEHPVEKDEYKSTRIAYSDASLAPMVSVTRRAVPTTTTTAAAAAAAASTLSVSTDGCSNYYSGDSAARAAFGGADQYQPSDNKLLFTSKRRNREELLHNMRRCSQLRRPLFIWEPYCVATS